MARKKFLTIQQVNGLQASKKKNVQQIHNFYSLDLTV